MNNLSEEEPALVGNEVDDGKVEVGGVQLTVKFLVLQDHLWKDNVFQDHLWKCVFLIGHFVTGMVLYDRHDFDDDMDVDENDK